MPVGGWDRQADGVRRYRARRRGSRGRRLFGQCRSARPADVRMVRSRRHALHRRACGLWLVRQQDAPPLQRHARGGRGRPHRRQDPRPGQHRRGFLRPVQARHFRYPPSGFAPAPASLRRRAHFSRQPARRGCGHQDCALPDRSAWQAPAARVVRVIVLQAATGRLCPATAQSRTRAHIGGQCRALWNHWLAVSRDRYAGEGKFAFYTEMSAALPALRKEDRYAGLPHRCAQMTVQKLDRALKDCAKSKTARKGFPRFKRRDDRSDAFQFVGHEARCEEGRIKLPALGWLRVRGLRIPEGARLVQVTVRQDRGGWALALQIEGRGPGYLGPSLPAVGIDVGLAELVALSTGRKIEPPRLARKQAKRLRRMAREKSRRRKGSVNRRRTVARWNREHARLGARRKDFTHKLTRELIDRHEGVAVETLRLKGLMPLRLAHYFR